MTTLSATRLSLHDIKRLTHGLKPSEKAMWLRAHTGLQWAKRNHTSFPFSTEVASLTHPGLTYTVTERWENYQKVYRCQCPCKHAGCWHVAAAQFESFSPLSDRPWAGDVLAGEVRHAA